MNDSVIAMVMAAIVYARKHPETFQNTTVEEDEKIEGLQVTAFIAGAEYAKNSP
jgi:hypothetical protein